MVSAAGGRSAVPPGGHPELPGSSAQGAPHPEVLQAGDGPSHHGHLWPLGALQGSPPEPGPGLGGPPLAEELKQHFQRLLGGLLLEAPIAGILLQLLTDLPYYALWGSEEGRKLAASSLSLLLAVSQRFPHLRTVIQPDLACFRQNLKEGFENLMQDVLWCFSQVKGTIDTGVTEERGALRSPRACVYRREGLSQQILLRCAAANEEPRSESARSPGGSGVGAAGRGQKCEAALAGADGKMGSGRRRRGAFAPAALQLCREGCRAAPSSTM
ncbi:Hypothetical predicted protein [Podarcis lilfordi]|uniref:Uncharacterized protein n=1 Tax=Podarcis lilfordi TaxID=74358 RepID=A0AA35JWU2_9SAUR|nr:Hypothetical predicted protein [Podarcis lilfordi]